MRTLVYSQCFLRTEEQGRLLGVNLGLVRRLNPGFDIMLIDNASPLTPWDFIPPETLTTYHRFDESIGHFSHKFADGRDKVAPRDGPGRAHMTALRMAMDSGYDRCAFVEDDVLFCRPLEEGFQQMSKPVGCLPRGKYGYLEWGVFWIKDLKKLDELKFIERYDWQNQRQGPGREGERLYEWLLSPNLQVLPYKVRRGEGYINEKNLHAVFPDGCDGLTHVSHETFAALLRMNGHPDLADKL